MPNSEQINHVFFDLDGTISDPFEGITRCMPFALEGLDHEPPAAQELAFCIVASYGMRPNSSSVR